MSRRRNFARTLATAFLLAVATALLLLPSAPADAQTTTTITYISNIARSASNYNSSLDLAQSFTTGSQTGGYRVTHIDIVSVDSQGDTFSATLYTTDASGHPDTKVADLTPPASFSAGTLTFAAPANTTLAASTTYSVRIDFTASSLVVGATNSNDEDSGGTSGWSIGDNGYFLNTSGTWTSITQAIRIAVKGTNAATGAPAITGTAQVGETLTAATSGIMDPDGLTTPGYTYQWIRVDGATETEIARAVSSKYTLTADDLGKTIKVKVSFTDDASNDETLTSAATGTVAAGQSETVVWTGTMAAHDSTFAAGAVNYEGYGSSNSAILSATSGSLNPDSFTYDGATHTVEVLAFAIGGSKDLLFFTDTPALTTDLAGLSLRITVDGVAKTLEISDAGDTSKSGVDYGFDWEQEDHGYAVHDWKGKTITFELVNRNPDDCAADTTTTCSVSLGGSVTGDLESMGDGDHFSLSVTSGVTYQIDAEGSETSMGTLADPYLQLRDASGSVIDSNDDGGTGFNARIIWRASSTGTVYVVIYEADNTLTGTYTLTVSVFNNLATGAPSISGTAQVGQTLSATTSSIADADGLTNASFTYQWIRVDGATETDISGATASSYTVVAADRGKTIKVKVSFTDDASNAETLTSAATAAVPAAVPDAPLNLRARAVNGEVALVWGAPPDNGAAITGYRVRFKVSTASAWENWVSAPTLSATVTGLINDTGYDFEVQAQNSVGRSASAAISATPVAVISVLLNSTTGQPKTGSTRLGHVRTFQQFKTGVHPGGYELHSIKVEGASTFGVFPSGLEATVRKDGPDGQVVAALNSPSSWAAGMNEFTAPANTILSSQTNYVLHFSRSGAGAIRAGVNGNNCVDNHTPDWDCYVGPDGWNRSIHPNRGVWTGTVGIPRPESPWGKTDSVLRFSIEGLPAGRSGQEPSPPENLSAQPCERKYVNLSWAAPFGSPDRYEIRASFSSSDLWRNQNAQFFGNNIADVYHTTETEYRHTARHGITYYTVRAVNANGPGMWSAVA